MAMLNYQQEVALFKLQHTLQKSIADFDYFEMLDLFRQLETEGYVNLSQKMVNTDTFTVQKTSKGLYYNYNWLHSEFR